MGNLINIILKISTHCKNRVTGGNLVVKACNILTLFDIFDCSQVKKNLNKMDFKEKQSVYENAQAVK